MDRRRVDLDDRLRRALASARDDLVPNPEAKLAARDKLMRRVRRPLWLRALAPALASVAVIALVTVMLDRDVAPPPLDAARRTTGVTDTPQATIGVGSEPVDLAVGGLGYVWVASRGDNMLVRIDPAADGVIDRVELPSAPGDIAIGRGPVWVALPETGQVALVDTTVDPPSPSVFDLQRTAGFGLELTLAPQGGVWVVERTRGISHVALDGTQSALRSPVPDPVDVAVKGGTAFVLDASGRVAVTDESMRSRSMDIVFDDCSGGDLIHAVRSLWCISQDGSMFRHDPASGQQDTIDVPGSVLDLAVDPGSAWVLFERGADQLLVRIDRSGRVDPSTEIELPGAAGEAAVGSGSVWVSLFGLDQVVRYPKG